jgi:outer membrane scaffolding protein for murein synthesis (MipA/OmpV family)
MFSSPASLLRYALAASLLVASGASMAQAFDTVRLYGAAPGRDGGVVGLGLAAGTQYQGSDERKTVAFPLLDYQWANGWFAGTGNGLGYNFSQQRGLQYGARLTADRGRKASDSAALTGMGDIDFKPEAGVFLNYATSPAMTFTSSLRYGSAQDGKGALLDLGAVYGVPVTAQWRLAAGVGATVANADYMQSYFGVTPVQSTASGYAPYAPASGLRDLRTNVSASYQWDARTSITTGVSASFLSDAARKSPIVRQSETTSVFLAVTYGF